jgi:hypothetical protein
MKVNITSNHLLQFKKIVRTFNSTTILSSYGKWRYMSNEKIWRATVAQIVVVGNSAPQEKMGESAIVRQQLSYKKLLSMTASKRIIHINQIFRNFGVRYAARQPLNCRKSSAVVHNLLFFDSNGGPKRFLRELAKLPNDYDKVKRVINSLSFIKSKGARDLLIELGLVKRAIAFDVRLQNILDSLKIKVPDNFASNETLYRSVEEILLDEVCKPLNISGSRLDRILFQHTDDIVKMFQ